MADPESLPAEQAAAPRNIFHLEGILGVRAQTIHSSGLGAGYHDALEEYVP